MATAIQRKTTLILLLILSLLAAGGGAGGGNRKGRHVHTDSFPPNDEYDFGVFDPTSLFGAPYGGYARATRSRLAKLPLRLVGDAGYNFKLLNRDVGDGEAEEEPAETEGGDDVAEEEGKKALISNGGEEKEAKEEVAATNSKPPYFRVRDGEGRPFVCRVYHEDELEPRSVTESMFDMARLRKPLKSETEDGEGFSDGVISDVDTSFPEVDGEDISGMRKTTGEGEIAEGGKFHLKAGEQAKVSHGVPRKDVFTNAQPDTITQKVTNEEEVGDEAGATSAADDMADELDEPNAATSRLVHQTFKHKGVRIHPPDIARQLTKLENVCSQLHLGWWSYEWCHGRYVTQFHIEFDRRKRKNRDGDDDDDEEDDDEEETRGATPSSGGKGYTIQDVTKIGTFAERHVRIDDGHGHRFRRHLSSDSDEDDDELAGAIVVVDTFANGAMCEETGQRRRMDVEIRCCRDAGNRNLRGASYTEMGDGTVRETDVSDVSKSKTPWMVLTSIQEPEVCVYKAKACTPLLCRDAFLEEMETGGVGGGMKDRSGAAGAGAVSKNGAGLKGGGNELPLTSRRKEDESIREILLRTLGNACLQRDGGWWIYEFCHTHRVRQFHPITTMDKVTGLTMQTIDDEYNLGEYQSINEIYPNEEEPNHVINVTDNARNGGLPETNAGGSRRNKKSKGGGSGEHGGNGAVFVQEYMHGDVCEDSDVTDAAIKGGNVVEGGIERATTVRFSCGKTFELVRVNEDSTCHYVLDVTVPDLCDHPLFKAPVVKTQVIKCLPVVDE